MRVKNILLKTPLFLLFLFILFGCIGKPPFRGEMIDPSTPAAEIGLPDQNGKPFWLSDMRGKVVIISFGFTNCVYECPLTMAHIKLALDTLGKNAHNVQVVLVSTDPVRDTPQVLHDYLDKFSPSFAGIPGTVDELKKVWDAYDVTVLDGGETHSSFSYVIDKNGNLRLTFSPDTEPEDIVHDLRMLLAEK